MTDDRFPQITIPGLYTLGLKYIPRSNIETWEMVPASDPIWFRLNLESRSESGSLKTRNQSQ